MTNKEKYWNKHSVYEYGIMCDCCFNEIERYIFIEGDCICESCFLENWED